jgi:hypothetical protein
MEDVLNRDGQSLAFENKANNEQKALLIPPNALSRMSQPALKQSIRYEGIYSSGFGTVIGPCFGSRLWVCSALF